MGPCRSFYIYWTWLRYELGGLKEPYEGVAQGTNGGFLWRDP